LKSIRKIRWDWSKEEKGQKNENRKKGKKEIVEGYEKKLPDNTSRSAESCFEEVATQSLSRCNISRIWRITLNIFGVKQFECY